MFVAYLMTFSIFFICIYATIVIINGIKEQDQHELATFHAQYNNLMMNEKVKKKLIA